MDQYNFLKMLQGVITGDGVLVEKSMSLRDFNLFSDGSTLTTTTSTNAGFTKGETNATILTWAATKVVAVGIEVHLPFDYDESKDEFEFHMQAGMGGSTDTPGFTANVYSKRNGVALTADLIAGAAALSRVGAVESTAALAVATTGSKSVFFKVSGKKLKGGDTLTFKITPGAHGTDAINVYAAWIKYRSDIVSFDPASPKR